MSFSSFWKACECDGGVGNRMNVPLDANVLIALFDAAHVEMRRKI